MSFAGAMRCLIVLVLVGSLSLGNAKNISFNTYPSPILQSLFNLSSYGWLGADSDTSIHISNNDYLWLFGDTFIGKLNTTNQQRMSNNITMIHSTIGIYNNQTQAIKFYWKQNDTSNPSRLPSVLTVSGILIQLSFKSM